MKKKSLIMATCVALALVLGLAGVALAGQDKPCKTNGNLGITVPNPGSYTYTQTSPGSTTATFTVSSPGINFDGGSCSAPYVYGNGDASIEINILVTDVSNSDDSPLTLDAGQLAALREAFSFSPTSFPFSNPGLDKQAVQMTFTGASTIPAGTYDVNIQAKPITGAGVGVANTTFTVGVMAPVAVKVDTLAPDVSIISPVSGRLLLNALLHVEFTANDPLEDGAGTGVTAVRAFIDSCGGVWGQDISGLSVSPALPVDAGVTVTATKDLTAANIGTLTLTAEADDNAGHTGSASTSYTVGVDVAPLPPISVAGRQFNSGSTVPIKWQVTGAGGAFLPPFTNIKATIQYGTSPTIDRVAGEGANYIRWELDASGNATQYITNYQIPSTATGTYTITIYVKDVCGNYVAQGKSFTFCASTKGGK